MGITARTQRSIKRKEVKRKAKQAKAALYKSYADKGRESGSKRSMSKRLFSFVKGTHPQRPCGNPACKRCYEGLHARMGKRLESST
jgi:hypothetical protein